MWRVVLIETAHYGQIQPPADGGERHMVDGKNLKINYHTIPIGNLLGLSP